MVVYLSIAGTLTALEDKTSDECENVPRKQLNMLSKKIHSPTNTLTPKMWTLILAHHLARTGRLGGQLYARAQSNLRGADYRAWMIRDRQGRTEYQTLALLYLVSSAARSALSLSGSKLICANTSTDASSSKSKDYYYYYYSLKGIFCIWKWLFLWVECGLGMRDIKVWFGLCCLMTPGLRQDIRCHVWPYLY